ncbi:MAG: hypothetical protein ACYC3W_10565 [Candidatus Nanopelagicales bacterium]
MELKDVISDYLVVFLAQIAAGKVKNEMLYDLGKRGGMFLTDKCRKELGSNWNGLEDVLQDKLAAINNGFNAGLNYDEKGTVGNV